MSFTLTILGSNSAAPTSERNSSSQLLDCGKGGSILLDCAEGTQIQIRKFKLRLLNIDRILITHLHGDHFFGLPGLLTTWHLLGRKKELNLYAPAELENLLNHIFTVSGAQLCYPIHFHAVDTTKHQCIYENKTISIQSLPLVHRMPCCGYLIQEKPGELKIIKEKVIEYQLGFGQIRDLKAGLPVTLDNGTVVLPEMATLAPSPPVSYAYCTDTAYSEDLIPLISGVHTLFHEATFMDQEQKLAGEKFHATARQAGSIARQAGAKHLLIGHFSSRYKALDGLLAEARTEFQETTLAQDGLKIEIR